MLIQRRADILELLSGDGEPPRLSELAEDLGVSVRTLRRDTARLAANAHDVRIDWGRVRYVGSPEMASTSEVWGSHHPSAAALFDRSLPRPGTADLP